MDSVYPGSGRGAAVEHQTPLLGQGDTVEIIAIEDDILKDIWFKSFSGVSYVVTTAYAAFAAWVDRFSDCPVPLPRILAVKAVLLALIAVLQLVVHKIFDTNVQFGFLVRPGAARTSMKRLLQIQQLLFFANMALSLWGFYGLFFVLRVVFASEVSHPFSQLPSDTPCGSTAAYAMTLFLLSWLGLLTGILLVSCCHGKEFFLKCAHFFPL